MRTFSFGALPRLLASSMIGDRRRFLHTHLTMDFCLALASTGLVGLADAGLALTSDEAVGPMAGLL